VHNYYYKPNHFGKMFSKVFIFELFWVLQIDTENCLSFHIFKELLYRYVSINAQIQIIYQPPYFSTYVHPTLSESDCNTLWESLSK